MNKIRIGRKAMIFSISTFIFFLMIATQGTEKIQNRAKMLELRENTNKAIVGRIDVLDIDFSSISEFQDYVFINIQLRQNKQLVAHIDYGAKTYQIEFRSRAGGGPTKLEKGDLQNLSVLNAQLKYYYLETMPFLARAMTSVLNLLEPFPPDQYLSISSQDSNQSITSLCGALGATIPGFYSIEGDSYTENAPVGPCFLNDCIGRCGPGCGSSYEGLYQRFTQDCFNHDLCGRKILALGYERKYVFVFWGPCGDEWLAAVDDWLFGPDCNAMSGDWWTDMEVEACLWGECHANGFAHLMRFSELGHGEFYGVSVENYGCGYKLEIYGTISVGNTMTGTWQHTWRMEDWCPDSEFIDSGTFSGTKNCDSFTLDLTGKGAWVSTLHCTVSQYGTQEGTLSGYKVPDRASLSNSEYSNIDVIKSKKTGDMSYRIIRKN